MKDLKLEVPAELPIPYRGDQYSGGVVVCSFPEIGDPNIIVRFEEVPVFLLAVDHRDTHEYDPW
jgi:hypothetical protein